MPHINCGLGASPALRAGDRAIRGSAALRPRRSAPGLLRTPPIPCAGGHPHPCGCPPSQLPRPRRSNPAESSQCGVSRLPRNSAKTKRPGPWVRPPCRPGLRRVPPPLAGCRRGRRACSGIAQCAIDPQCKTGRSQTGNSPRTSALACLFRRPFAILKLFRNFSF
jgi:hypothetical protein